MHVFEGHTSGDDLRIAIVVSRFNDFITGRLLDGASETLERNGLDPANLTVAWCPGAFEIPLVAGKLAASGNHDAIICLGAVIRGDTPHFEYVASAASEGATRVALDTGIPVIFGVLTTDDVDQAVARSGPKDNKGSEAALAAIETVNLLRQL